MLLSDATAMRVGSRAVTAAYLGSRAVWSGAPAWSPSALFAVGEQGLWYDPSDMSTLFQDSDGTVPVTAMEQPVGKILDKSGRGNHASQTTSTRRPTISARYNVLTGTSALATQSVTTLATAYTLRFSGAGTITLSGTASGVKAAGVHEITCTEGTLTLTVSGSITDADMRNSLSIGMPSYQRVTSASDYDATGFMPYLKFDGVDDKLNISSLNLSASDSVVAVCGLRKMSDAGDGGMVFETSTDVTTTTGSLALMAPSAAGANSYRAYSRGATLVNAGTGVFAAAPDRSVISISSKIRTTSILLLRRNGAFIYQSNTVQGTGNYGNYAAYIGGRANDTQSFNGHIYGVVIRGGGGSLSEIEAAEVWMNTKMKAY